MVANTFVLTWLLLVEVVCANFQSLVMTDTYVKDCPSGTRRLVLHECRKAAGYQGYIFQSPWRRDTGWPAGCFLYRSLGSGEGHDRNDGLYFNDPSPEHAWKDYKAALICTTDSPLEEPSPELPPVQGQGTGDCLDVATKGFAGHLKCEGKKSWEVCDPSGECQAFLSKLNMSFQPNGVSFETIGAYPVSCTDADNFWTGYEYKNVKEEMNRLTQMCSTDCLKDVMDSKTCLDAWANGVDDMDMFCADCRGKGEFLSSCNEEVPGEYHEDGSPVKASDYSGSAMNLEALCTECGLSFLKLAGDTACLDAAGFCGTHCEEGYDTVQTACTGEERFEINDTEQSIKNSDAMHMYGYLKAQCGSGSDTCMKVRLPRWFTRMWKVVPC